MACKRGRKNKYFETHYLISFEHVRYDQDEFNNKYLLWPIQLLERISLTLARHAARAVARRQTRPATAFWGSGVARRFLWEASVRGAPAEVEGDCAHLYTVEGGASNFQ